MATKKPVVKKDELISCEVVRKLQLEDGLKQVGDIIEVPRDLAKKFQDVGAIKINL